MWVPEIKHGGDRTGQVIERLRADPLATEPVVLDEAERGGLVYDGVVDGPADLPHEEARDRLVALKGIGPWTADGALLIAFG